MKKTHLVRLAIISALITQVSHAAYVFNTISKTHGNFETMLSYVFAFSLELSIYIFTLEKKRGKATFFAIISMSINLLYYWNFGFDFKAGASLLISFSIPATIWTYSDLIFEDIKKNAKAPIKKKLTKKSTTKFKNVIAA